EPAASGASEGDQLGLAPEPPSPAPDENPIAEAAQPGDPVPAAPADLGPEGDAPPDDATPPEGDALPDGATPAVEGASDAEAR
ncbi:MAG TPA: hypothetical protein VFC77_10880, partial [Myxococcota bacterium]|nr:hypothetical protein [Myxococcota bacterium]